MKGKLGNIDDLAELTGISRRTLFFYRSLGIFKVAKRSSTKRGGRVYYDLEECAADIERHARSNADDKR